MSSFLTIFTILLIVFAGNVKNSVLDAEADYYKYTIHDDPDLNRNVSELISSKGYPVEEHEVVTSDGYVLGIQRIPGPKSKTRVQFVDHAEKPSLQDEQPTLPPKKNKVVLLHHGLLSSAADWVINFENQSLGYILADAGYDVWLANARGNTYSRKHRTLSPESKEFWKFSWDEIALYDVPATIDYILGVTGQEKLHYVGHSMGTTVIFALLSERVEYNEKVESVFAYAPVATVAHMTTPVRFLAPFSSELEFILDVFGEYDFLPNGRLMKFLSTVLCADKPYRILCENVMFLIAGPESRQFNESRLEVLTHHTPAGTSTYTVAHYAQLVRSKLFRKFDYGERENLKKYGQDTPPSYQIEKITAPVAAFWSESDAMADPEDTRLLKARIKNVIDWYRVPYLKWSHLDYVYGVDANKYVHDHLLRLLQTLP